MTPERFRQIEEVFDAAADTSSEERPAVLDRLCGDDAGLRAEVEALLAASPKAAPEIRGAIAHIAGEVALVEGATSPQRGSPGVGALDLAAANRVERHVVEGAILQRGVRVGDRFTRTSSATSCMGRSHRASATWRWNGWRERRSTSGSSGSA